MFTQELEVSLHMAFVEARQNRYEFITVEHLLLILLDNPSASGAIRACGGNIECLRRELADFINSYTPRIGGDAGTETQPTQGFQRVIQRAVLHAQSSGRKEVNGASVLIAIFSEKDSHAVYYLVKQNISRLDIVNFVAHGISKTPGKPSSEQPEQESEPHKPDSLGSFTVNLNRLASRSGIDPLIGRSDEVDRVIRILCRRRKNNPLLVGEAGVGKTAIAEGLARKIVEGNVPGILSNATIYALDIGSMLAGTKYRGDFEQRLKSVVKELTCQPHAILFIDEIHTLIGAGSASGGTLDASNLLKPALSSGHLKCIGATTYTEFRSVFEKDRALSRRFQKIDITEPSTADTIDILKGLKSRFETHHGIKYSPAALVSAVELSVRFITDRFLPDKAIDVIDEAGAAQHLLPRSKQKKTIGKPEIEEVVSKMARIPSTRVSSDDKAILKNLARDMKSIVFGQDAAIEALTKAIRMARSGLGAPDRPIGNFLFSGPTGVGKTEVAKQLAYFLNIDLLRFDMSEYMERHAVSRLIGAPPGYVGFDQGGLLTEGVTRKPHCVLLLDEIEKAHPDIYNILLQIMDHGTLTDNNGRKADFRNVIIVMTTNAGQEAIQKANMGFSATRQPGDEMAELRRIFSPEFRNRLDATISFKPLDYEIILRVVDKFLMQLEQRLNEKKVEVTFSDTVKRHLAKKGFDPLMGARPMARLIQDTIQAPLADELLFGRLANGGQVSVDMDGGGNIRLLFEEEALAETV
ncbi:MAG: ATP-dependent Clp protease ATP-binding subunit ClpA [Candidatus Accumulibacter sp.]|jgi:ATP-dependent Clp protease ATP-binding subunit ClpA|nr:ATP-dependent Clp protease ATP-binding subunit ClpA [Accumulibacter sp.]